MEIETLKKSHLKRNIVIAVVLVSIISTIILTFTKAKFKNTESIPLVNGIINYELSASNLIGVYIEDGSSYTKTDQIPDSGYTLNEEESYCKIGEEKQDITITYDMNTKNLTIRPLTTKGTKCYLYFDEQKILLAEAIKRDNQIKSGTPDFSQVATTNEGVYKTEDDWGESYYFRGAVTNNWVKFAGFYWRIIRINGDGSIRLIYSGNEESGPAITGESTQIGTSAFNNLYNDNAYVGYMYGKTGSSSYEETHANINDSTIKQVLDNWYETNLKGYEEYINTEAGFCADRTAYKDNTGTISSGGNGKTITYYGAYIKLYNGQNNSNASPNIVCNQRDDLYTIINSNNGNKSLKYPIGLITADEVALAGGMVGENNKNYYLYTQQSYWTLSPYQFNNGSASVFSVNVSGWLFGNHATYWVNSNFGIRPVINIASDVTIKSGNGTSSTPYEI